MSDIRTIDIRIVDEVFDMQSGYVLDFSDRTMSIFFEEELNIDIDAAIYRDDGDSKAKRLRCFLRKVDNATAAKTLRALLAYKKTFCSNDNATSAQEGRLITLIANLEGQRDQRPPEPAPKATNIEVIIKLRADLIEVWKQEPQRRGYEFEKFLTNAFSLYGLNGREGFRNRGEQIDGSFDLDGATYLLEAKWTAGQTSADDLHTFEGKISQKAVWARGLFVSYMGFTTDGLHAFGRGKRTVAMCGQDFDEAFERQIPLDEVVRLKARRAAETGSIFIPVRELFR
jgi:hypothetical protein